MSRILLIKPRLISLEFQFITQPLGLMYIGSSLKIAGHEVKIHDCAIDYDDLHILKSTIMSWKPDFIGISIIITELEQTKKIMEIIRESLPNVPVTFGGPWPTANPEKSLKIFGADFVVMGEGEFVFPNIIDAINKTLPTDDIPGTASLINSNLKINPGRFLTENELNALPFPAWDLLNHKFYAKKHSFATVGCRPYMSIITSRGCPFKCSYCHRTLGKVFRKRSTESVLSEMEELYFNYGFKEFEIVDDCFNLDRKRMYAILNGIRERLGDVKLHFPNGLRPDILEPDDMIHFKKAGTVSAVFAIETTSPRLQKMIRKNLNIKKAANVINAAVEAGIYSSGFFMIGFPTETYDEASATVEFAARSPLHRAYFFNPSPFQGTELADLAADVIRNRNTINAMQNMNYYNRSINISAMSDLELQKIFRLAYRRVYMNPKRILRFVIHHPQILSLPRYAFLFIIKILPRKRVSH
jgi:anaerobic magnesium-protoporphyrin IX monomethyl ester cyclase